MELIAKAAEPEELLNQIIYLLLETLKLRSRTRYIGETTLSP